MGLKPSTSYGRTFLAPSLLRSPKGRHEGVESDQNMENKLCCDQMGGVLLEMALERNQGATYKEENNIHPNNYPIYIYILL